MDFIGQNPRFINADLVHLETARSQLEAVMGAIQALKERAILNATQERLGTLLDGVIDVKGDLNHFITEAEDAATMKAAE